MQKELLLFLRKFHLYCSEQFLRLELAANKGSLEIVATFHT